jgi:type VI secretion system protein ImpH
MASENRASTSALSFLESLTRSPYGFDFHVALRRIESAFRDKPRLGEAARPEEEPVRLGQEPSTEFASSMLRHFMPPAEGAPGRLLVSFFGLFGPNGPLPLHLTEYARDRQRNAGDATFASFANIFHHRLLLLFHRAWSNAQPTAAEDRPESSRFKLYIGAIAGFGQKALLGRNSIPDIAKFHYAGRFSAPTRNAEGLRAVLADYFGLPTEIEQFVGEWIPIPENGRFSLGHSKERAALGQTTVLGAHVWSCQHKFRVVLGPLSRDEFQNLLPGSERLDRLVAMVRTYVGDELGWDARLVLGPDATDQLQLRGGGRLGWNTRVGKDPSGKRIEDLIVNPMQQQTQRFLTPSAS